MEVFSIVLSAVALSLSAYVYHRQRRSQLFSTTKGFNAAWQEYNQVVLADERLLEIERSLHPHGDLSLEDTRRLVLYFMRFNVAYSAFLGSGEMQPRLAESAFNNEANVSFHDRKFIRKHVFGRGYDRAFTRAIEERWAKIEAAGKSIPMLGDDANEFVSALT